MCYNGIWHMDPCRCLEKPQQMSAQSGNNLVRTSHTGNVGTPNPCFNIGIEDPAKPSNHWQGAENLFGGLDKIFNFPVPWSHCPQDLLMAGHAAPFSHHLQRNSTKCQGQPKPIPVPCNKGALEPNAAPLFTPSFPLYHIFHASQAALNQVLAEATEPLFSSKHLF